VSKLTKNDNIFHIIYQIFRGTVGIRKALLLKMVTENYKGSQKIKVIILRYKLPDEARKAKTSSPLVIL